MDRQKDSVRFSEGLANLEKYFDKKIETAIRLVYFAGLADLTIEQFEQACGLAMARLKWFPKIAELRELVEGSGDDRGQQAWNLFETAVARVGYYNSLWVDDHALAEAIRLTFGGWTQACTALHPVYAFYEKGDSAEAENEADEISRNLSSASRAGTSRQVAGLSPEMIQAERKKFLTNYRNASRESRVTDRYLLGASEVNNRSTVIRRGFFPVNQPVGLIAGGQVSTVSLQFIQGQLSQGARLTLEQGEAVKLIAAPKPKLLEAAPDESLPVMDMDEAIATKDETLSGLEQLRDGLPERFRTKRVEKPTLTPQEIIERARLLRQQIELLKPNKSEAAD